MFRPAVLTLLLTSPLLAQGFTPEEAVKRMKLPDGFKAVCVAHEPMIRQPLSISFDTRGQYGTVESMKAPTPTLRPPPRIGAYWRLLSHLSLNHLSITDPEEGRDALREYLRLYDYADPRVYPDLASVNKQVVDGLERVGSEPDVELIQFGAGTAYARGTLIHLALDEEKFEGIGSFLFASVIDRFLAMYASINSFTRLKYYTRRSGDAHVKVWPPRIGTRPLL